jgi:hypothetical protein
MKINLILILFTLNIFAQKSDKLKIIDKRILVSSGQLSKYEKVKINNIDFKLVVENKDTIYLSTNEVKFIVKEGYNVGTKFSELPLLIKENLNVENGWGYFYTLPSGWSIGFCEGKSCTDNYPKEDSKIAWIFKRK